MISAIKKTVTVPLTPQEAFRVFTSDLSLWWPVETHSVSAGMGAPSNSVALNSGVGGEIEEIAYDGTKHVWGKVTEWRQNEKVAFTWHPRKSEDRQTLVEVSFEGNQSGTTLTLVHSGWEKLGEEDQKLRPNYTEGWNGVLERFLNAV